MYTFVFSQQFGTILDVEIIFNERGSKVSCLLIRHGVCLDVTNFNTWICHNTRVTANFPWNNVRPISSTHPIKSSASIFVTPFMDVCDKVWAYVCVCVDTHTHNITMCPHLHIHTCISITYIIQICCNSVLEFCYNW